MLANVRIASRNGRISIRLDGQEMADHVLADGFAVDFGVPGDPKRPATVTMNLVPADLDVVLEDAEVEIVDADDE